MNRKLIFIGGVLNLLLGIFHVFFWKIFGWPETVACLEQPNLGILYALNAHSTMVIFFFAFISLKYRDELLISGPGRAAAWFIALFYLLRAVDEFIFFPMEGASTVIFAVVIALIGLVYAVPLWRTRSR